jgi:hypothetical protein
VTAPASGSYDGDSRHDSVAPFTSSDSSGPAALGDDPRATDHSTGDARDAENAENDQVT